YCPRSDSGNPPEPRGNSRTGDPPGFACPRRIRSGGQRGLADLDASRAVWTGQRSVVLFRCSAGKRAGKEVLPVGFRSAAVSVNKAIGRLLSSREPVRSNEARRAFPRKPEGRRVFWPRPALARPLQPAAGMLGPRRLGRDPNPSPRDP